MWILFLQSFSILKEVFIESRAYCSCKRQAAIRCDRSDGRFNAVQWSIILHVFSATFRQPIKMLINWTGQTCMCISQFMHVMQHKVLSDVVVQNRSMQQTCIKRSWILRLKRLNSKKCCCLCLLPNMKTAGVSNKMQLHIIALLALHHFTGKGLLAGHSQNSFGPSWTHWDPRL